MKTAIIVTLGLLLPFAESPVCAQSDQAPPAIALTGGTVIDVSHSGHGTHDIANAVVVLRAGKIEVVGSAAQVKIPKDAKKVRLSFRQSNRCSGLVVAPASDNGGLLVKWGC